MLKFIRIAMIVVLASVALIEAPSAQAQSNVKLVWPGGTAGWYWYNFGGAPEPAFGYGPGAPPLGTGSFGIFSPLVVPNLGGAGIGRGDFVGTPLSAMSISYWTYYNAASGDNWRLKLYINTTGSPSSADCAVEYVHAGGPANTWLLRVPTAATGGYTPSGGWVWRSDEITAPSGPCNAAPNWGSPVAWSAVTAAYPSAVLAPNSSGTTIVLQIFEFSTPGLNGVIDAVTINGITWDFEVDPPPASFFDPGDGRYDPRPGDRLAAYCEAKRVLIYGVNNQSRGFLLGAFEFEALKQAGEEGIYLDKGQDGILSASMSPSGHIWVAWTGGQYNASGRPEHGFAKLVRCGTQ
jgi:hypothetical protein